MKTDEWPIALHSKIGTTSVKWAEGPKRKMQCKAAGVQNCYLIMQYQQLRNNSPLAAGWPTAFGGWLLLVSGWELPSLAAALVMLHVCKLQERGSMAAP